MLRRQGLISLQQQEAVQNINGHSSKITQEYYIRQTRNEDVSGGRAVFEAIANPQLQNVENVTAVTASSPTRQHVSSATAPHGAVVPFLFGTTTPVQPVQYSVKEWGTKHPDFALGIAQRCQWTPMEVQWIGRWIIKDTTDHPLMRNRVARCLKALHMEPTMWPWFHRNHVLNSARMRAGWDKYLAEESDE